MLYIILKRKNLKEFKTNLGTADQPVVLVDDLSYLAIEVGLGGAGLL